MAAFQAEMPAVPKTSANPFFNSKYADLADVVKVSAPVAAKHGLSVTQLPGHGTLWTYLLHESGEFIASEMDLKVTKDDSQALGSALTYARRYSYCAALGIVADEDDDGNASARPEFSPPIGTGRGPARSSTGIASDKQIGLIKHLFNEQGYSQDERAGLVKAVAGRDVKTINDLTSAEASAVIEDLKREDT